MLHFGVVDHASLSRSFPHVRSAILFVALHSNNLSTWQIFLLLKGSAHLVYSNSPGPPLHALGAGEVQASSWEQALYASSLCDLFVMTNDW